MFLGNISEDAEQHLIRFNNAYDIFNLVEYDVACWVFVLSLHWNALEWFSLLLPRTIIDWEVLESLFIEKYFPRKDPQSLFLKLVNIEMYEKEIVKNFSFKFMTLLHEIP